jgi:hypothetical protein
MPPSSAAENAVKVADAVKDVKATDAVKALKVVKAADALKAVKAADAAAVNHYLKKSYLKIFIINVNWAPCHLA